jgi:hypothetical protein
MSADDAAVRTKNITVHQVRVVLEEIAATYQHRRDRRSGVSFIRYINRGVPNCLVALVLERLGFSLRVLSALDREYPTGDIVNPGVRVSESRHPALCALDPVVLALLDHVQQRQGKGRSWRKVVTHTFASPRFLPVRFDQRRRPWLYVEASTTEEI